MSVELTPKQLSDLRETVNEHCGGCGDIVATVEIMDDSDDIENWTIYAEHEGMRLELILRVDWMAW